MDNRRITMSDVRRLGLCSRGLRAFAEEKPIAFQDFVSRGATVSELLALNDALADWVIEKVYGPEALVREPTPETQVGE